MDCCQMGECYWQIADQSAIEHRDGRLLARRRGLKLICSEMGLLVLQGLLGGVNGGLFHRLLQTVSVVGGKITRHFSALSFLQQLISSSDQESSLFSIRIRYRADSSLSHSLSRSRSVSPLFSFFSSRWMPGTLLDRSALQRGQALLILSHSAMHLTWKLCWHLRSFSFSPSLNSTQQMEQHSSSSSFSGLYLFSGMARMFSEERPDSALARWRLARSWMRRLVVLKRQMTKLVMFLSAASLMTRTGFASTRCTRVDVGETWNRLRLGTMLLSSSSLLLKAMICLAGRERQTYLCGPMRLRGYLTPQQRQEISRLGQALGCESSSVSRIWQSQWMQGTSYTFLFDYMPTLDALDCSSLLTLSLSLSLSLSRSRCLALSLICAISSSLFSAASLALRSCLALHSASWTTNLPTSIMRLQLSHFLFLLWDSSSLMFELLINNQGHAQ